MKKVLIAILLLAISAIPAFAQDVSPGFNGSQGVALLAPATWPTAAINGWIEGSNGASLYPFQTTLPGFTFYQISAFSIKKDVTLILKRKIQYKSAGVWKQATMSGIPLKQTIGPLPFYPSPHWIWFGWPVVPDQTGLHRCVFTLVAEDGTVLSSHTNMFWVGTE